MVIDKSSKNLDEEYVQEIEAKWAAESEERIDARGSRRITDNRWTFGP